VNPQHLGQHERSLPRRERREDVPNGLPVLGVGEVVARRSGPDRSADREHGAPVALAEQVHRGPVQVPEGVVHPTDAVPSLPHTEERVLHQLLRLGVVPGHEPQPPEQCPSLHLVEGLEGAGGLELVEGRVPGEDPFAHVGE
jgi:hypothetical protein